jgi:hypothetical protein
LERGQTRVSNDLKLTQHEIHELEHSLDGLSERTGETAEKLQKDFQAFASMSGIKGFHDQVSAFENVVLAARGMGISVDQASKLAVTAIKQMGISAADLPKVFDAWASEIPEAMLGPFTQKRRRSCSVCAPLA